MLHRLKSSNHFMAFFVQVCATALGLLIALGIDQWKTARANHKVMVQSMDFLRRDLHANREALGKELASLERASKGLNGLLKLIQARQLGPVPADSPLRTSFDLSSLSLNLATLQNASWEAAIAHQAITHFDQWRVEKVARVFSLQKDFLQLQNLALTKMGIFFKVVPLFDPSKPDGFSARDLQELHAQMSEYAVFFQSWKESGQELKSAMDEALHACQAP